MFCLICPSVISKTWQSESLIPIPVKKWHFPWHVRPDPSPHTCSCHDHEDHVLPLWRLRGLRLGKDRMSAPDLTQMMIELSELAHILPTLHYHRSLHEAGFYAAIMTIVFNTESSYPEVNYSLNILYNEIPIILNQLCGAFLQTISWMTGEQRKVQSFDPSSHLWTFS